MEMTRKEFQKNNTRMLSYGFFFGVVVGIIAGVCIQ